jgi:hypothetical protein
MVYMAVLFILLMLGSLTLAVLLLHSGGRSVLLAPPPVSSQTRSCSRGRRLDARAPRLDCFRPRRPGRRFSVAPNSIAAPAQISNSCGPRYCCAR